MLCLDRNGRVVCSANSRVFNVAVIVLGEALRTDASAFLKVGYFLKAVTTDTAYTFASADARTRRVIIPSLVFLDGTALDLGLELNDTTYPSRLTGFRGNTEAT
jgi:hypothetical protein